MTPLITYAQNQLIKTASLALKIVRIRGSSVVTLAF